MGLHGKFRQLLLSVAGIFSVILFAGGLHANSTNDANPLEIVLRGSNSSGGGYMSISQLIIMIHGIFERTGFACSEDRPLLEETLNSAHIISVDRLHRKVSLVDNGDGTSYYVFKEPIPDEEQKELIAWGSPGFIQIKSSSAKGWTLDYLIKERMPFAHLLVHEVYRASGKTKSVYDPDMQRYDVRSVDHAHELTIGKYQLNQVSILPPVAGTVQSLTITDQALVSSLINAIKWRNGETSSRDYAQGRHYLHTDNLYSLGTYTTGGIKFGIPKLICRTRVDRHKKKYTGPAPYCVISAEQMITSENRVSIAETVHGCSPKIVEDSLWGRIGRVSTKETIVFDAKSDRVRGTISDNGVFMLDLQLK